MAVFFGSGGGFPTWVNANVTLAGHWNGVGTGYYTPAYAGATALTVAFTIQPLGTEFNVVTNGKGWMSQQYGGAPAHAYWVKHLGGGAIQCAIWGANLDNPPRTIQTGAGVLVPDVPNRIMMRWQGGATELFTVAVNGTIYSPTPAGNLGGPVSALSLGPDGWNNPVELGGASAIDEGPVSGIYQQWAIWKDYLPDSDAQNYGSNGNPGLLSRTGLYWVTLAAGSITDRNGVPGADPPGFYTAGQGPIGHLVDGWSGFQYGGTTTTYDYGGGPYQQPFNGVFEHFTEVADLSTGGVRPPALPEPVMHLLSGPTPILDLLGGTTITVGSGANDLHDAIYGVGAYVGQGALNVDGTHKGNTYVCPAGAVYNGLVMPDTNNTIVTPTSYTCIRTAGAIPAFGTRVGPTHTALLFKVLSDDVNGLTAIHVPMNSHGWRFIGMELTHAAPSPSLFLFINGRRVCVERSYIHGLTGDTLLARCIYINRYFDTTTQAEDVQIWDSSVTEAKHTGADAQAIYFSQARRMHVENCLLEGAGETIMISDQFSFTLSYDLTFRRNHFHRPSRWLPYQYATGLGYQSVGKPNPEWDGVRYVLKDIIEIKSASRVLFEGNHIENTNSVGFFSNTQQYDTSDITIQHNLFENCVKGYFLNLQAQQTGPNGVNRRIKIYNNFWKHCVGSLGGFAWFAEDVWVEHNTFVPMSGRDDDGDPLLYYSGEALTISGSGTGGNFARNTFRRNVLGPAYHANNLCFINMAAGGEFETVVADRTWAENAIYNHTGSMTAALAGVHQPIAGFTGYATAAAAGIDLLTGHLSSTSPLRFNQLGYFGTDGKDIGVDFNLLNSVMANNPTAPTASFFPTQLTGTLTVQFQDTSS